MTEQAGATTSPNEHDAPTCQVIVRQLASGSPVKESCGDAIAPGETVCRSHARLAIAAAHNVDLGGRQ